MLSGMFEPAILLACPMDHDPLPSSFGQFAELFRDRHQVPSGEDRWRHAKWRPASPNIGRDSYGSNCDLPEDWTRQGATFIEGPATSKAGRIVRAQS